MIRNLGKLDRWLRIAFGGGLLCLALSGPHTAWGWLGIVPLMTGIFGFCPLYSMMGWTTERPSVGHT